MIITKKSKSTKSSCCSKKSEKGNCLPASFSFTLIGISALVFYIFITNINKQNKAIESIIEQTQAESGVTTKTSINKEKVIALVNRAGSLVQKNGVTAFEEFNKPNSEYWKGDSYVFVYDMTGKTLVLPPQPTLEGVNRLEVKDQNGVYYVKEMINALKTKNTGWLQYSYPKPGESTPSIKLSYFKKVKMGNSFVIVGSGFYLK